MKRFTKSIFLFTILTWIGYTSCVSVPEQFTGIPAGKWRATLNLDGVIKPLNTDAKPKDKETLKFDEVTQGEIPFIFDVIYDTKDDFHIEIINGTEKINVPKENIILGIDSVAGRKTIIIDFPHYDSYIKAYYQENIIEGYWIVETKENYRIKFLAKQGDAHRFSTLKKTPKIDISGKWEVLFGIDTEDTYPAIGEFQQNGNYLTGTFLTETGDFRFLEGTIQDDKVYLSCFDGSHAFLFAAKIDEDKNILGSFRSGKHYQTLWTAKRNDKATLTNPNELTYLKEGYDKLSFSFTNTSGKIVSLTDEKYKGKNKIVQIIGTWCPNCADETEFLTQYLKENPIPNLEVIALAFEKHKNQEKAFKAINTFKKRFDVPYEVLLAGNSSKTEASERLPMLNKIISYPTMIFLDQNDKVLKIHTGFSGPATSKFKDFEKEFHQFIQNMTKD